MDKRGDDLDLSKRLSQFHGAAEPRQAPEDDLHSPAQHVQPDADLARRSQHELGVRRVGPVVPQNSDVEKCADVRYDADLRHLQCRKTILNCERRRGVCRRAELVLQRVEQRHNGDWKDISYNHCTVCGYIRVCVY